VITFIVVYIDALVKKLEANNIFLIAQRNIEQKDLLYLSLKFINNIWTLAELKMENGPIQVSCNCAFIEISISHFSWH